MGTVTDMDGKFTIKAERGDKLVFSYTGFKKREYVVMGKECEHEGMREAAVRNYEKALQLCPDLPEAKRRLKKLKKQDK